MKNLKNFDEFLNEGKIESVNESTFGIKTDGEAAIKGLDSLTKDLDGAKIKYKINRLSMTLSVINVDKKDYKKTEEIINKHISDSLSIMMAKESVNEGAGWIEAMNYDEIANALGKIARYWDEWKAGPLTEPSHINPAAKELKGWIERFVKKNIK